MSYVARLLGNERESLLQLANEMRAKVLDPKEVMGAVHEIDRALGLLRGAKPAAAAPAAPGGKKRGRKPRGGQLPRGESDDVFAQGGGGASDTIPPTVGADDEVNGDGEEAVA